MILDTPSAVEQIQRLRLLPGFPGNDAAAMEALIDLLVSWFTGGKKGPRGNRQIVTPREQLIEVIDQVLKDDERWSGPSRLRKFLDARYSGMALYGDDCKLLETNSPSPRRSR
jgi:hypothetical protein